MDEQITRSKKYIILFSIGIILAVLFVLISFLNFQYQTVEHSKELLKDDLKEFSSKNMKTLQIKIESEQNYVKSIAKAFATLKASVIEEKRMYLLDYYKNTTSFDRLWMVRANGKMYTYPDVEVDISNTNLSQYAETQISGITPIYPSSVFSRNRFFGIHSPIYQNGFFIGNIVGIVELNNLSNIVDFPVFQGEGYTSIFQSSGEMILSSSHENNLSNGYSNLFDFFSSALFKGSNYREFIDDITTKKSGFISYQMGNEKRLAFYEPVTFMKDWYMLLSIPESVVLKQSNPIYSFALELMTKIFVCFAILFLCIIYYEKNARKRLMLAYQQVKISNERFLIAVSHASREVMEYDIKKDRLYSISKSTSEFNFDEPLQNLMSSNYSIGNIDDEYQNEFVEMFKALHKGQPSCSCVIKSTRHDGTSAWNRITFTNIYDDYKKPIRAIGTIEDITEMKQEEITLRNHAERDLLTGLYNRNTAFALIANKLQQEGEAVNQHAFFIMDLDQFKYVNDTYGHKTGDELLINLAVKLKKLFPPEHIVSRMGGDEFIIFYNHFVSVDELREAAAKLLAAIGEIRLHTDKSYRASGSVGIAIAPEHGTTCTELYENADIALYSVKKSGKNNYKFFEESMKNDERNIIC